MAKRTDIQSILILGAGPIVIGQACEFDYSGAQACKALREEGYRVILVNSNPATIMTDPNMADATYIEPITWQAVSKIIEVERPDAILPTMGGQTALNCALDLERHGVLEQSVLTAKQSIKRKIVICSVPRCTRSAWICRNQILPIHWKKRCPYSKNLVFQSLSAPHLLWAAAVVVSLITVRISSISVSAVYISARPQSC